MGVVATDTKTRIRLIIKPGSPQKLVATVRTIRYTLNASLNSLLEMESEANSATAP